MKTIILIGLLTLSSFCLALQECKVSYKYRQRCPHYDVRCLEIEPACEPLRLSFRNPRCPVVSCVSESSLNSKSCFIKMCYCRDSFCKCCKEFLKTLSVTYCNSKHCKKTVYAKFTATCNDCLKCRIACSPMKRLPRSWYQTGTIYLSCFAVDENKIVLYLDNESESF